MNSFLILGGNFVEVLDATGLKCPLPVLKAKKVMKSLPAGETLNVLSTDSGAPADFAAFCEMTGYQLIESSETDGVYSFVLAHG